MTHPHLEGLIRKWRERAEKAGLDARDNDSEGNPSDWEWAACHYLNKCAGELSAALAALPGGGVDAQDAERYRWLRENITERLTDASLKGEFAEHKTQFVLPTLIAWADFCGPITLDEAIDFQLTSPAPSPHEADRNG